MTFTKPIAGAAGVLLLILTGSAALAASKADNWFVCQTWTPTKASPPVTHCLTWTRQAAARMRAADCDPAKMTEAQMRAKCAELSKSQAPAATPPNAG